MRSKIARWHPPPYPRSKTIPAIPEGHGRSDRPHRPNDHTHVDDQRDIGEQTEPSRSWPNIKKQHRGKGTPGRDLAGPCLSWPQFRPMVRSSTKVKTGRQGPCPQQDGQIGRFPRPKKLPVMIPDAAGDRAFGWWGAPDTRHPARMAKGAPMFSACRCKLARSPSCPKRKLTDGRPFLVTQLGCASTSCSPVTKRGVSTI